MTNLNKIIESYYYLEPLKADGLDDAIIGIETSSGRLVYSKKLVLKILIDTGISYQDAIKHYNNNIVNSYIGEKTPIWVEDDF